MYKRNRIKSKNSAIFLRQCRAKTAKGLCMPSAYKFSVLFHKPTRECKSIPCFLSYLTKKSDAQSLGALGGIAPRIFCSCGGQTAAAAAGNDSRSFFAREGRAHKKGANMSFKKHPVHRSIFLHRGVLSIVRFYWTCSGRTISQSLLFPLP